LDPMPEERTILMKLLYYDDVTIVSLRIMSLLSSRVVLKMKLLIYGIRTP